jgi:hypothetical protein
MKKYNQYTLENHFKILEIQTGRKNPCDIMEFLEHSYYSKSKKEWIQYKDMDITYLVRVLLKNQSKLELDNDINNDTLFKMSDKLYKIKQIMED